MCDFFVFARNQAPGILLNFRHLLVRPIHLLEIRAETAKRRPASPEMGNMWLAAVSPMEVRPKNLGWRGGAVVAGVRGDGEGVRGRPRTAADRWLEETGAARHREAASATGGGRRRHGQRRWCEGRLTPRRALIFNRHVLIFVCGQILKTSVHDCSSFKFDLACPVFGYEFKPLSLITTT
jgi:hypothetical protein